MADVGTYVISFDSTHSAMAASKRLKDAGVKFMTIPLPTAISAGCGMAALFESDAPLHVFETATGGAGASGGSRIYRKLGRREFEELGA